MTKGKHLVRTLHHSKPLWAVFSLLFSLLLLVGSTYSWLTYSDERINRTGSHGKELSAVIDESFTPNFSFAPGTSEEKKLTVRNNGQVPAIVRVSLYEFFLSFETVLTDGVGQGNGHLKIVTSAAATEVDIDQTATWGIGHTYQLSSGSYLVGEDVYLSTPGVSTTAYVYQGTPSHAGLSHVTIRFNTAHLESSPPAPGTTDYWYYENGYFYYSEILQPGEQTEALIEEVYVATSYPNTYEGALYKLTPVMDAHDISASLLSDWGLGIGDHAYDMYQGQVV